MNKKAKEKVEELKQLMLNMHRSASELDGLITGIEMFSTEDSEFNKQFVKAQYKNRQDWIDRSCVGNLSDQEKKIWLDLIDAFSKD